MPHGYVAAATLRASRRALELLAVPHHFDALVAATGANAGHLQVALRTLRALGWVLLSDAGEYAAPPATLAPAYVPTITDSWVPHPSDPLRFVKAEIRQLLLRRGPLSIAQLPEEYLKFYRRPLTQALKMVDSQYTPESARGGKPSGRARKATLGAFLREHLADAVEVRQRPHGQHEIVAFGTPPEAPASGLDSALSSGFGFGGQMGGWSSGSSGSDGASPELSRRSSRDADDVNAPWHRDTPEHRIRAYILLQQQQQQSQQRQLDELRDALQRVGVTPAQPQAATDALLGFASSTPGAAPASHLSLIHISEPTRPY